MHREPNTLLSRALQDSSRPTPEELRRARPYKPRQCAADFEADKVAVLEELRRAGSRGVSTLEFLQRGIGGLRPPNRVHDCRKDGHIIETRREGRGQFRFILIRDANGAPPLESTDIESPQIHKARRSAGAWKAQPIVPVKSWDEIVAERDRKIAEKQAVPDLVLTP